MTAIRTILLSGALVFGTTLAHAQVTDPARPDQGNAEGKPGVSTTAPGQVTTGNRAGTNDPATEPARPDQGNAARSQGTSAPAVVAPAPRAGAGGATNEPSRPDQGNAKRN